MTDVECAFANFAKAKIFSVLDLNSVYYQNSLSAKSRKATVFSTPFGLYEFNNLPMGISVACQVLSRVVDSLFGVLKGKFVYNFIDDLVVYSSSFEEHFAYLREIFARPEKAAFTLNQEKLHLASRRSPFGAHNFRSRNTNFARKEWRPLEISPLLRTLRACADF
jgi:hypothetical protein